MIYLLRDEPRKTPGHPVLTGWPIDLLCATRWYPLLPGATGLSNVLLSTSYDARTRAFDFAKYLTLVEVIALVYSYRAAQGARMKYTTPMVFATYDSN